MRLADARWPDVDTDPRTVLVVPVGSLEQHGPHLPLDTDTVMAAEVAARVAAARPGAWVTPPIAIGASGEHQHFPGTLSVGTEVLRDTVVELVRSAGAHWSAVLIVNGHGGNANALDRAEQTCRYEGRRVAVAHVGLVGMDAHAGRAETSMLLHLAPHRVRLDLAEPGDIRPLTDLLPILRRHGVRAVSPTGVLGDPTGASETEGAALLDAVTDRVVGVLDRLVASPATEA